MLSFLLSAVTLRLLNALEDFCTRRHWIAAAFWVMWLKDKFGYSVWR